VRRFRLEVELSIKWASDGSEAGICDGDGDRGRDVDRIEGVQEGHERHTRDARNEQMVLVVGRVEVLLDHHRRCQNKSQRVQAHERGEGLQPDALIDDAAATKG